MDLPPEKWERVKELLALALELRPEDTPAFLDEACPETDVRRELERLLAYRGEADSFLSAPLLEQTTPPVVPHSLQPGAVLSNRFLIIRFIARGGMGEVYEAEDQELREKVAVKTIRQDLMGQPRFLQTFRREVHLAKQVTHPNVCRIYDLFRHTDADGETIFVSMEFLTGETLAGRIKRTGPIPTEEALPIILQLAEALNAAHGVGILHRDFKPGNVILQPSSKTPSVRAVVTDFGLAFDVGDAGAGLTLHSSLFAMGTPAYMAPEQIEGRELNAACDIYALGLVMHEMVTGRTPFDESSPMLAAAKRLYEPPASPRKLVPDLNRGLETIILRCLEREPSKRPRTAAEVSEALRRIELTGLLPRKRNITRWAVGPWSIAAVILMGAAIVSSIYYFHSRRSQPLAPSAWAEESVLWNFTGGGDGGYPYGNLIPDSHTPANLYGTTSSGGANGKGVVFELLAPAYTTQKVLYSFCTVNKAKKCIDGESPRGGLAIDDAGNLYGTTASGGRHGYGEVFKLDTSGNLTELHDFSDYPNDGNYPSSGLFGPDGGYLYGETKYGGTGTCLEQGHPPGCGTVFRIDRSGHGYNVLYSFRGHGEGDGELPTGVPSVDANKNIYGTTYEGGKAYNLGMIFKLAPGKNGYTEDSGFIHSFKGYGKNDGSGPSSGLILSPDSKALYGAAQSGGKYDCVNSSVQPGCGTLFRASTEDTVYTQLLSFSGKLNANNDGIYPEGAPVLFNGVLYGTTYEGGAGDCTNSNGLSGCGTIYRLPLEKNQSALYSFKGSPNDGANPVSGAMPIIDGILYGTTVNGGLYGYGTVYAIGIAPCRPQQARHYDAVADFSVECNTNTSRWSYRYNTTGSRDGNYSLLPYVEPSGTQWYENDEPIKLSMWFSYPDNANGPCMFANKDHSQLTELNGEIALPPLSIYEHPSTLSGTSDTVLTFLAPNAGEVKVTYSFTHIDADGGQGIDWYIDLNSGVNGDLYSGYLPCCKVNGTGPLHFDVEVKKGDRINFIVAAHNGDFDYDSTALTASVDYH
jgi:uncharacterized repeat protein (TIGR03803 family)